LFRVGGDLTVPDIGARLYTECDISLTTTEHV
jgi:hypothetical protein